MERDWGNSVPPARTRSWNDVLDNLGENLIRLGTSLSVLADTPANAASEATFIQSMERIATGFRLAFRQARPALVAGEAVFVQLTKMSVDELATVHSVSATEKLGGAHTLVHEGVLVCQEMVALLNLIEQGAQTEPERTRQTFLSSLRALAEVTASSGWDLRNVSHEYEAESRLTEGRGGTPRPVATASMGLLHDMAEAARGLRAARREWFRIGQRLSSVLGPEVGTVVLATEVN